MRNPSCFSKLSSNILVAISLVVAPTPVMAAETDASPQVPLRLHPDNPHYFLFRGQPAILITSGEHYGAVLNVDFDYAKYLATLERDGLNLTRTFTGAYVEPEGAFNIRSNSMAPRAGRFVAPWARSATAGYAGGGNKFDLTKWDPAYFARLKDFVATAARHGVIVELNFFCPFYEEIQWNISPQNAINNVNHLGAVARTNVYTLNKHGGLLSVQEALVRKIVEELNIFDNLYYEICNEPYFGGVTLDWQHHIAELIATTEQKLPHQHLISRNVSNGSQKIDRPHPAISIFNFHYAIPPDAVGQNYQLNKVIGDNETGFLGTNDAPYRMEAWDFLIAGGGLFNHLDYSFTVGHEDGTFVYPGDQPGGGNPGLRQQFRILRDFLMGFPFIRMQPDSSVIRGVSGGYSARALSEPGKAYAIYLRPVAIPAEFSARWSGEVQAPASGVYGLHLVSNDGGRLWIDHKLLIDDWEPHSDREKSAEVRLEAGRKYPIKVEHYQGGGTATLRLLWTPPNGNKEIIPQTAFTADGLSGLQGDYFAGTTFSDHRLQRRDPVLDFKWKNESPLHRVSPEASFLFLDLDLPRGAYRAEWINPVSGKVISNPTFVTSGRRRLNAPSFDGDLALRIKGDPQSNASSTARPKLHLRDKAAPRGK